MDTNINIGSVGFFSLYSFNVHDEFLSVYLNNFANLVSLVMSTDNLEINKRKNIRLSFPNILPITSKINPNTQNIQLCN